MSWFVRVKQGLQKSPGQSVWVTPTSSITSPQMDTSAVCDGLREQEIKGLWSRQKHLVTFKSNFACQHHWVCLDFNILTHLNMKPHDDNHSFFKVCFYFCRQGTWDKHQLLFLETPQSSEGLCALWFLIGDQCMLIVKLALWGDRTPLFSYSSLLKQADTSVTMSTVSIEGKLPNESRRVQVRVQTRVNCRVHHVFDVILRFAKITRTKFSKEKRKNNT